MTKFFKKLKKGTQEPAITTDTDSVNTADIADTTSSEPKASSENRREHIRIKTDLQATLRLNEEKHSVKIADISVGGARIVSNETLPVDETVSLRFTLPSNERGPSVSSAMSPSEQGNGMLVLCKIVHKETAENNANAYGAKFVSTSEINRKLISAFVLDAQVANRFATQ